MAVAFAGRASIGATATSVTTGSFTPSANSRLFAFASGRTTAAVPPTITDSLGGTWTLVAGSNIDFTNVAGSLYYQDIGASPAAMTVTATGGGTQTGIQCFDVTGHSTDLSNFATGTNSAGDPTAVLPSTPAAASFCVAMFAGNAGGTPTSFPAGYSQVYQVAVATNLRMCLFTDATSGGATQAWVTPSTDSIAYGLEIKEAGAAGAINVNVTGQSVTASTDTASVEGKAVIDANGFPLTAELGSLSAGSAATVDLAGLELTAAVGSPSVLVTAATDEWNDAIGSWDTDTQQWDVFDADVYVVGLQASVSVGDITASIPVAINLIGQDVTATVGTVQTGGTTYIDVTGFQMAVGLGDETVRGKANVTLDAPTLTMTLLLGDEATSGKATAAVLGQQVTVGLGNESVVGKANVSVTGHQLPVIVGNVGAAIGFQITGLQMNAYVGTAHVGVVSTGTALGMTLELGEVSFGIGSTIYATMDGMVAHVGDVIAHSVANILVDGFELTASVGNVSLEYDYAFEVTAPPAMTVHLGRAITDEWGSRPEDNTEKEEWIPVPGDAFGEWIPVPSDKHVWQKATSPGEVWTKHPHNEHEWTHG